MRHSAIPLVLAILLLAAAPAWAADEAPPKTLSDLVGELEASLDDADAAWEDHWAAYRAYMGRRDALDTDRKHKDKAFAARAKAELDAGKALYMPLQERVAKAVRRDAVPLTGWVMGLFGAALLWGGFLVCMTIAIKDPKKIPDDAE